MSIDPFVERVVAARATSTLTLPNGRLVSLHSARWEELTANWMVGRLADEPFSHQPHPYLGHASSGLPQHMEMHLYELKATVVDDHLRTLLLKEGYEVIVAAFYNGEVIRETTLDRLLMEPLRFGGDRDVFPVTMRESLSYGVIVVPPRSFAEVYERYVATNGGRHARNAHVTLQLCGILVENASHDHTPRAGRLQQLREMYGRGGHGGAAGPYR